MTGGQRYEALLRETLIESHDVGTVALFNRDKLSVWNKLAAPFISLVQSVRYRKGSVAVFNSSDFYLLPLLAVLRLRGVTTVVIHHHFIHEEFEGFRRWLRFFVEYMMLKSARKIITPGPSVFKRLSRFRDVDFLAVPFERRNIETRTIPGQLLFVGTVEPRKGLHLLVEALLQRPERRNFELHIVGEIIDPDYRSFLQDIARKGELNIRFHGWISERELSDRLEQADIFLFPSKVEGFGIAMNEARFYGLPVVAFHTSGIPYSVTDGEDGFLVPPYNTSAFGRAVANLVKDRGLRSRMSRKSLERSLRLSTPEEFACSALQIFGKLSQQE